MHFKDLDMNYFCDLDSYKYYGRLASASQWADDPWCHMENVYYCYLDTTDSKITIPAQTFAQSFVT